MSHDAGQKCLCIAVHNPEPLELNHHHIWPQEYGGPTVPENLVWLCPTTHTNVHELLRLMVHAGSTLSWYQIKYGYTEYADKPLSRYAYDIAKIGYLRYVAGSVA